MLHTGNLKDKSGAMAAKDQVNSTDHPVLPPPCRAAARTRLIVGWLIDLMSVAALVDSGGTQLLYGLFAVQTHSRLSADCRSLVKIN